jgi:mitogen-activated protein kinase 1/3
LSPAKDATE